MRQSVSLTEVPDILPERDPSRLPRIIEVSSAVVEDNDWPSSASGKNLQPEPAAGWREKQ